MLVFCQLKLLFNSWKPFGWFSFFALMYIKTYFSLIRLKKTTQKIFFFFSAPQKCWVFFSRSTLGAWPWLSQRLLKECDEMVWYRFSWSTRSELMTWRKPPSDWTRDGSVAASLINGDAYRPLTLNGDMSRQKVFFYLECENLFFAYEVIHLFVLLYFMWIINIYNK